MLRAVFIAVNGEHASCILFALIVFRRAHVVPGRLSSAMLVFRRAYVASLATS